VTGSPHPVDESIVSDALVRYVGMDRSSIPLDDPAAVMASSPNEAATLEQEIIRMLVRRSAGRRVTGQAAHEHPSAHPRVVRGRGESDRLAVGGTSTWGEPFRWSAALADLLNGEHTA